jgi:hypothetical protein
MMKQRAINAMENDESFKNDYKELMDYKHSVDKQGEEEKMGRTIKRKSDNPQANKKDFM